MSDDIDEAILELCELRRLSAVSCLVALERCGVVELARLLQYQAKVDIGLHLCFTDETLSRPVGATAESPPPYFASYGAYLRRTLLGRVAAQETARQASYQYELFLKKCGREPDFIDGHLHAHQLPGVRQGVVDFVLSLPPARRPYIRNTRGPLQNVWRARLPILKAATIGVFGRRMHGELGAAGLRTNEGFSGIYDFRDWRRYPDYFPRFADSLPHPNGLLVVHPGGKADCRRQEFTTLREFGFAPRWLNRFQTQIF